MHGLVWGGALQIVLSGYNKSFGNASAFYIEAPFIPGFHLKCGASQSPDSQCFDCAFSAPYGPDPSRHCSSVLASTPPNGAHSRLNLPSSFQEPGG
jgi:hypothetical protein